MDRIFLQNVGYTPGIFQSLPFNQGTEAEADE